MSLVKTTYYQRTNKDSEKKAAQHIYNKFKKLNNKVIIYFLSPNFSQNKIAKELKKRFSDTILLGCTSAGEMVTGKLLEDSIVAMSLTSDLVEDAKIQVIENLKNFSRKEVAKSLFNISNYFKKDMFEINNEEYVGLILIDGLSSSSDKLMKFLSFSSNIPFVGGSAADNLQYKNVYVHSEGKAYKDAATLLILKPKINFDIIKTQSFEVLDKDLKVTSCSNNQRRVCKINNKKAADVYSKELGCEKSNIEGVLRHYPLGLILDNKEPYVKSPIGITDEGYIDFHSMVPKNRNLKMLKSTNLIERTKKDIEEMNTELNKVKKIKAAICFNCILRKLQYIEEDQEEEFKNIFSNFSHIGANTFGEEFITHVNHTLTMVVFGV